MDEKKSCAFQMNTGNRNDKFYNTFVVSLPLSLNLYEKGTADKIKHLFEKLVQMYMPFWGCISNKALSRKYGSFLNGELPTTIHWMNYWSEGILCEIGMERIQKIINEYPGISFSKGVLSIRDTALNIEKEDIKFHSELQKQLFLKRDVFLGIYNIIRIE